MAGSGTTMLACTLGRNVILVELEEKFVKMCQDNWEQVKMRPQLGYTMGECVIMQGDARQLEDILCDKIITSPPFGDTNLFRTNDIDKRVEKQYEAELKATKEGRKFGVHSKEDIRRYFEGQITNPNNIGNLPYGAIFLTGSLRGCWLISVYLVHLTQKQKRYKDCLIYPRAKVGRQSMSHKARQTTSPISLTEQ
jgi:predicted RNA methylase